MSSFSFSRDQQRRIFLLASGISTAGSFAGLTAKGWILLHETGNPLLLAMHFGALSLPTLFVSGFAGVCTDRIGSEVVLARAQLALFIAAILGAFSIPLLSGNLQIIGLLLSTFLVGIAGAFELTSRNKYCALLVSKPHQLAPYLVSFSVVFNVGKLMGPPLGGWLIAAKGSFAALTIDAISYLFPIITVAWLLKPNSAAEKYSPSNSQSSFIYAWRESGSTLRNVIGFTAIACLVGFFHPGLAPLIAEQVLGSDPRDLGFFTSIIAAGSITGGVILQRNSIKWFRRPFLTLSGFASLTAIGQVGMSQSSIRSFSLLMAFLIGAGTAGLLSSCNLMTQLASPQVLRGRMAGLSQIAFLGGGGLSGIFAAFLTAAIGLRMTFGVLGMLGLVLAVWSFYSRGETVLEKSNQLEGSEQFV